MPDPKAQVVAVDRVGAAGEPEIELVGPPPGAPAKSQAAEQQPPRPAAETGMFEPAHATRWGGRSRLSNHLSWLSCPRAPLGPAAARRASRGRTAVRPSRHWRAQRANAAATSCSAPIRRASCSRDSSSTCGGRSAREPRPLRRARIPGEASAASWYQAPLSACSASSSEASASGAAACAPGRSAAVWKFRAASAKSAAHWSRRSEAFMPASSRRRREQGMGLNAQWRPAQSPSARALERSLVLAGRTTPTGASCLARSDPRDEHVVRSAVVSSAMTDGHPKDPVVDLLGPLGWGPRWGLASSDLNATLLAWPAGHSVVEHTTELDVLVIVLGGDGVRHDRPARPCHQSRERAADREGPRQGDPCRRRRYPLSHRAQAARPAAARGRVDRALTAVLSLVTTADRAASARQGSARCPAHAAVKFSRLRLFGCRLGRREQRSHHCQAARGD